MSHSIRAVLGIVAAASVVVALSACAPATPTVTARHHALVHSSGPSPTRTPTPTGPAPLPAAALFRITATVTDANGASADLVETVYAATTLNPSDSALLTAQCDTSDAQFEGFPDWHKRAANPELVTAEISATLAPGSPAWPAADDFTWNIGGYDAIAFSGESKHYESDCADGEMVAPGTVHIVMVVPGSNPALAQSTNSTSTSDGWAAKGVDYGFQGPANITGPPDDLPGSAKVTACSIQLSAAASSASPAIASWGSSTFVPTAGCEYSTPS